MLKRRLPYLLLAAVAPLLALGLGLAARAGGQQRREGGPRERGACRKECLRQYRECRSAGEAGEAEEGVCDRRLEECREECAGKRPKSADNANAEAGREAAPADNSADSQNANSEPDANTNANANVNSNSNDGRRTNHGGREKTPPPPDRRSANRPPA